MSQEFDINWDTYETQLEEGNGHIKFGLGVGIFGAASLAVIGATCPLCFFVAPAMVGVGLHKRYDALRNLRCRPCGPGESAGPPTGDGTDGTP